MERIVQKEWGEEHWIVNRDYCGKKLILRRGLRCSMHYHKVKDETFHLEDGLVFLELGGREMFLRPGDSVHIPPGVPHRFSGLEDSVILEFSTHHEDEDSYRESVSGPIPGELFADLSRRAAATTD